MKNFESFAIDRPLSRNRPKSKNLIKIYSVLFDSFIQGMPEVKCQEVCSFLFFDIVQV